MKILMIALIFVSTLQLAADPVVNIKINRSEPCNTFIAGKSVTIESVVKANFDGSCVVKASVINYWSKEVFNKEYKLDLESGSSIRLPLELGNVQHGYYELEVTGKAYKKDSKETKFKGESTCFGVIDQAPVLSAKEFREGGYRFGMKLWTIGDIWWNRSLKWDAGEVLKACELMGLQWTRALMNQTAHIPTTDLFSKYRQNVIIKVEGFPENCFDEARYGKLEEFKKKYNQWNRRTLPLKEPYQKWLREQIVKIPEDQLFFEIWNEAWQWYKTMPARDFARLCNWASEVIKEVRPNAIIGPNIHGHTTENDIDFIAGNGLKDMSMIAVHPYTAGTPETKAFRTIWRNYRDYIYMKTGTRPDLYSTEFGWSTAPKDEKRAVNEVEQAQRTVRECLMMYAEGIKTLIPHTMGQREQDLKEREHYFGFWRLNMTPKPVIVAYSNLARMIDASTFEGDLWFGEGVGAMLFKKGGVNTLALWSEEEGKKLTLNVDSQTVTHVDIMGLKTPLEVKGGEVEVLVSDDVIYLVGVGDSLLKKVLKPGVELKRTRWKKRASTLDVNRAQFKPVIDGDLADWKAVKFREISETNDMKIYYKLNWDNDNLYMAFEVPDNSIVNPGPAGNFYFGDHMEIRLSARPERQLSHADLFDHVIQVTPKTADDSPASYMTNLVTGKITLNTSKNENGVQWHTSIADKKWIVEMAVPFSALHRNKEGVPEQLAFNVIVFDRDTENPDEWKQTHKRAGLYSKKARFDEMPVLNLVK